MSKPKSTSINVKDILSGLKDLEASKKELDKKFKSAGTDAVEALKVLVTANPNILALRWNQYTPYFNDGDTCEFSVNEMEVKFDDVISGAGDKAGAKTNDEDGDEDEDDSESGEWVDFGEYGEDLKEYFEKRKDVLNYKDLDALEKAVKMAYQIHDYLKGMEQMLLLSFGDHVEVTVTRKGIETDSYDHD